VIFRVDVQAPVDGVPAEVVAELRARMLEIARVLGAMPERSPIWETVSASGQSMDVKGWRFRYRVDRQSGAMVVDQAALVPA
jgi:hypothetical protein